MKVKKYVCVGGIKFNPPNPNPLSYSLFHSLTLSLNTKNTQKHTRSTARAASSYFFRHLTASILLHYGS